MSRLGTSTVMETAMDSNLWAKETADKPDPNPLPDVKGSYILVRPLAIPDKVGSLYLPDQAKSDYQHLNTVGRVLALGHQAYKFNKIGDPVEWEPWVKVGDYVLYHKYGGEKYQVQGVNLILLQDTAVRCVVDNPSDIIPGVVKGT